MGPGGIKGYLLPAGLSIVLHLIAWLAISGNLEPKAVPCQQSVTVALCQMPDKAPAGRSEQARPVPPTGEQRQPETVPPPPAPDRAVPREPVPVPAPPRAMKEKKVAPPKVRGVLSVTSPKKESGAIKMHVEEQRASALPEVALPAGPAAVQEKGAPLAPPSLPPASVSGGKERAPLASPLLAPEGQGQESKPVYKDTPEPPYPALARRMGYQGTVELEVLVSGSGMVEELRIATSSGYPVLDKSALEAVRRWRFEPGTRDAVKQPIWVKIPVRFKLR